VSLVGTPFPKLEIHMYRNYCPFIISLVLLSLIACTEKPKQASGEPVPVFINMDKQDTTEVLNLVNQYFGYLTDGRTDDALGMIKYLDGDSIKDVPEDLLKKQKNSLKMIRPIRYEIEYYIFRFETDCVVKYKGILFEKEEDDTTPNTISYFIKPIRFNDKWYLTMADSEDANTLNSDIPN